MTKNTKTIITTILLAAALFQGPYFYYFGYETAIIFETLFCLVALFLTLYLLVKLIKFRSTTTLYHIIGLTFAFITGVFAIREYPVKYLDFKLRKAERIKIIEAAKAGN
jgi:predicted benzoate:H+ symporter BenE